MLFAPKYGSLMRSLMKVTASSFENVSHRPSDANIINMGLWSFKSNVRISGSAITNFLSFRG